MFAVFARSSTHAAYRYRYGHSGSSHARLYTRRDWTHTSSHSLGQPKSSRSGSLMPRTSRTPRTYSNPRVNTAPRSYSTSGRSATSTRDIHGRITRSTAAKNAFKRQQPCPSTGRGSGACPGYVIDHVKPLECGGSDSPSNMQWQTIADGKAKDKMERSCR